MNRTATYFALFAGLVLVSTSGPFIVASGVPATTLVFWRLFLSGVALLAWSVARGRRLLAPGLGRPIVGGALLLALHFLLWVKAFDLTDYASNLLLLVAQPIVAAFVGRLLGEPLSRTAPLAIGISIAGLLLIGGSDLRLGPRALLGDAMCILGAAAIALFYVVTRRPRETLPLESFLGLTFLLGAAMVLPVVLASDAPLVGFDGRAWTLVVALVVLTTLGGHGLMNVAAKGVPLFTLNIVIVLEPPLGILLGLPLFDVSMTLRQLVGGALLAVAVLVALWPTPVRLAEPR